MEVRGRQEVGGNMQTESGRKEGMVTDRQEVVVTCRLEVGCNMQAGSGG